jgi:hypothetical protein
MWAQGSMEERLQDYLFLYPLMYWHGGSVMPTVNVTPIFWGGRWKNAAFRGDKITGMDAWYGGFGNSNYAATSNEYQGSNGQVTSQVNANPHLEDFDTSAWSGNYPKKILAEVCSLIANPDPSGYYPVYTDLRRPGGVGYCAYHSFGSCGNTPVQFAFFWDLTNDSYCSLRQGSPDHSRGLDNLSNASAHELSEARTDPRAGGWYDFTGFSGENGDKCVFVYLPGPKGLVAFSDGTQWRVQGEWSNNAYLTKTGYPNKLGQKGCLLGN